MGLCDGGTDGLGLAYCEELLKQGFNIVIISRNIEKLTSVQTKLKESNPDKQIRIIEADFSQFNA